MPIDSTVTTSTTTTSTPIDSTVTSSTTTSSTPIDSTVTTSTPIDSTVTTSTPIDSTVTTTPPGLPDEIGGPPAPPPIVAPPSVLPPPPPPIVAPVTTTTTTTFPPPVLTTTTTQSPGRGHCPYSDTTRIVGGVPTQFGQMGFTVRLEVGPSGIQCGGALINNYYVLTAAHCFLSLSNPSVAITLGDRFIRPTDNTRYTASSLQVIVHEDYNRITMEHDIALVRLDRPVPYSGNLYPVCLAQTDPQPGSTAFASGWGHTTYQGTGSGQMMMVGLHVLSHQDCVRLDEEDDDFLLGVEETMLCTCTDNKDACQGDSGGPLVYVDLVAGKYELIGVISFGHQCALPGVPGVYSRVTEYTDWVTRNTAGTSVDLC
ncbi:hypothetical protein Pcinc_031251 [Petrolisthes cinctipes]|uniref:limulus clotting factor C n=1 Tax=Petrolisthes cinctipes TaxID=88211 RepID=A0AAE1K3B3_PETCI|nr:hypothetical protein Pcinc_031251 [Petrolisthes cinctipes]